MPIHGSASRKPRREPGQKHAERRHLSAEDRENQVQPGFEARQNHDKSLSRRAEEAQVFG